MGLFLTNSVFAQIDVKTIATSPVYPTMDSPITIYLNIKNWKNITSDSLSVYTGLVTSKSDNPKGWTYVKNGDWNDTSLKMEKIQDSIYSFVIDNPKSFYGVPEGVETYKITFIARGIKNGANNGQTEDIFLNVYGAQPSELFNLQPAEPTDKEMICVTWNINANSDRNDLKGNTDSLWVHTWIKGGSGPQSGSGNWPDNAAKYACERVNDSILRWFIAPTTREFYKFQSWTYAESIGVLIRNKEGNAQTNDFNIPLKSERDIDLSMVAPYLIMPPFPTVNDEIAIYVNTKNWNFSPENNTTAYTGLITSASTDVTDNWQHVANTDWNDASLALEKINDSISVFVINSIPERYGVNTKEENVFRIAFIARENSITDNTIKAQTENLYFEIFGGQPNKLVQTQPLKPNEDDAVAYTFNVKNETTLSDYIVTSGNDSIYIYTWLTTNEGEGNEVTPWGDVSTNNKLKTIAVNDSIFRFIVPKSVRNFYGITDACTHIQTTNLILRNAAGTKQTSNILVDIESNNEICTGIEESISNESFMVYPNPTADYFRINYTGNDSNATLVELSDLSGKKVISQKMNLTNSNTIDVSTLSKGVYFLNIKTKSKNINSTVIVK